MRRIKHDDHPEPIPIGMLILYGFYFQGHIGEILIIVVVAIKGK